MEGYNNGAQPKIIRPTTVVKTEPVSEYEDSLNDIAKLQMWCAEDLSNPFVRSPASESPPNVVSGINNPFRKQELSLILEPTIIKDPLYDDEYPPDLNQKQFPLIPEPSTFKATGCKTVPEPNVSNQFLNNYNFNDSTCVPPSLDRDNIGQSLSSFEKYCEIIGVPLIHKSRLLLAELKKCCENSFLYFLDSSDNTYAGLKRFILRRFESIAKIHKLNINPTWTTNDAFTQFSNAVDLYNKTPPHEFVKFLVLRTSPISVQQSMQGYLNLPYAEFYKKYKSKLDYNTNTVFSARPLVTNEKSDHQEKTRKKQTFNHSDNLCTYHQLYNKDARNCSYKNCPMSHLVAGAISRVQSSFSKPKNAA